MKTLEKLYAANRGKADRVQPIKVHLVQCYRHFANDYASSSAVQISYLKKIKSIDPTAVTAQDKQMLELE